MIVYQFNGSVASKARTKLTSSNCGWTRIWTILNVDETTHACRTQVTYHDMNLCKMPLYHRHLWKWEFCLQPSNTWITSNYLKQFKQFNFAQGSHFRINEIAKITFLATYLVNIIYILHTSSLRIFDPAYFSLLQKSYNLQ